MTLKKTKKLVIPYKIRQKGARIVAKAIFLPNPYVPFNLNEIDLEPKTVALKKKQIKINIQKIINFIPGYFIWNQRQRVYDHFFFLDLIDTLNTYKIPYPNLYNKNKGNNYL